MILVTGRSHTGTSMLMAMLHAGGIEPIYDSLPQTDKERERYPQGYYETQSMPRVDRLISDYNIAPYTCAKVFNNEMADVIHRMGDKVSHVIMTERPVTDDPGWKSHYYRWQKVDASCKLALSTWGQHYLVVNYYSTIADPYGTSRLIASYLNLPLQIDKMAAIPDKSLIRT